MRVSFTIKTHQHQHQHNTITSLIQRLTTPHKYRGGSKFSTPSVAQVTCLKRTDRQIQRSASASPSAFISPPSCNWLKAGLESWSEKLEESGGSKQARLALAVGTSIVDAVSSITHRACIMHDVTLPCREEAGESVTWSGVTIPFPPPSPDKERTMRRKKH